MLNRGVITLILAASLTLLPWFIGVPLLVIASLLLPTYWEGVLLAAAFDFFYSGGFSVNPSLLSDVPLPMVTTAVVIIVAIRMVLGIKQNSRKVYY